MVTTRLPSRPRKPRFEQREYRRASGFPASFVTKCQPSWRPPRSETSYSGPDAALTRPFFRAVVHQEYEPRWHGDENANVYGMPIDSESRRSPSPADEAGRPAERGSLNFVALLLVFFLPGKCRRDVARSVCSRRDSGRQFSITSPQDALDQTPRACP